MTAPESTIFQKKISLICFNKADSLRLKIMFTIGILKTEKLDFRCIGFGYKEGSKNLDLNCSNMKWKRLSRSKSNYQRKNSKSYNIRLMKKRDKWKKLTKSIKRKYFDKREQIGKKKRMRHLTI
jgi:hypothetical protein